MLQLAKPAVVPAARAHVAEVGLNVPVEFVEKLTVPVGPVAPDDDVSVTVAVHVVWLFTWTDGGLHETAVVVAWGGANVTARLTVVLVALAPSGEPVTMKL